MSDITVYALLLVAGFMAGVVNTLAGSGSLFALSALLFAGLPVHVANGTNRLGIVLQSIVGTATFRHYGLLNAGDSLRYLLPSLAGAMLGAFVAVDIDKQVLEITVAVIMALMLVPLFFSPKKALADKIGGRAGRWTVYVSFFVIGFYGGFIQLGVGIFALMGMVLVAGADMVRANAVKTLIVLVYALPVFAVFVWHQQVDWQYGSILAVGQMAGAYLAGRFAARFPNANTWIKWLVAVMVLATVLKMAGLFG